MPRAPPGAWRMSRWLLAEITVRDSFYLTLGWVMVPVLWWVLWRVWRHDLDLGPTVGWATGDQALTRYYAWLLPGDAWYTSMMVLVTGILVEPRFPGLRPFLIVLALVTGILFIAGLLMALTRRPRFLLPPVARALIQSEHDARPRVGPTKRAKTGRGGTHRDDSGD